MSDAQHTDSSSGSEPAILRVSGLSKTFRVGFFGKKVEAVRGVSFSVQKGQLLGYLGPNGSGKTTSIKCILGLIQPTSGTIELFGGRHDDPMRRARIGYMPEHPYFYDYLKPTEVLDYVGRLYGIPADVRTKRSVALLERLGLGNAMDRPLRGFSKGMLQRVGLAQSLVSDPDLLVYDEPLSGLDPFGRKQVRDLLFELRAEGKTIFVTSHVLSDIEHICDSVVILRNGKAIAQGSLEDLLQEDQRKTSATFVLPADDGAAEAAIAALPGSEIVKRNGEILTMNLPTEHVPQLTATAAQVSAQLVELHAQRDTLEELFLRRAIATGDAGAEVLGEAAKNG
jgi:ABC-2 type transport system ATP-binding protein